MKWWPICKSLARDVGVSWPMSSFAPGTTLSAYHLITYDSDTPLEICTELIVYSSRLPYETTVGH